MQDDGRTSLRAAVPRWRSLARTSPPELGSPTSSHSGRQLKSGALTRAVGAWKADPTLVNAADVMDAATTFSDAGAGRDAALQILADRGMVPAPVAAGAARLVGLQPERPEPSAKYYGDSKNADISNVICRFKARLKTDPRDALSAIEVARLQTLIGQARAARRYVEHALRAAPENRYVLRCSARYFTFINEPDVALAAINKSEAVRYDSWVQAAEVAVADLAEKTPKWGIKSRDRIAAASRVGFGGSELALGLATLEFKHGGRRKFVTRLAKHGLCRPTENALAQAVWLESRANIGVNADQQLVDRADANDALAMRQFEGKLYEDCVENAWRWVNDQPFSPRGYLLGASCASIHLSDHRMARAFCQHGLRVHPNLPPLLNALLVAHAYLGDLEAAMRTHRAMREYSSDSRFRPFISAGRGLIAYRTGDLELGRRCYTEAMRQAHEAGHHNIAVNAMIYWLEQEAKSGVLTAEEWDCFKKIVNERLSKLSPDRRAGVRRTWESRAKQIDDLMITRPLYTRPLGSLSPTQLVSIPLN